MRNKELGKLKDDAVNALVQWGKTKLGLYSMRNAVNAYMEACGADRIPFDGEDGVKEKRKIVAEKLIISCITPLSKEQLNKVESELKSISNDIPSAVKSKLSR